MTDTNDTGNGDTGNGGPAGAGAGPEAPHIQVHAQYVKDLSFENPGAPHTLANQGTPPKIEVSVDVGAHGLSATQFEVELRITAHADQSETRAFVVEVQYAGVFTLHNVDENSLKQICLIECPRLLFPFARRVVADATRDGGFPPLLLDPIDFAALYRQSADRIAEPDGEADGGPGGNGNGNGA